MNLYHLVLACTAAIVYGDPSERLVVIGVTGTNGKSSTVQFLGKILEGCGAMVGWTTTASFKIADREWVNDQKMTMLGRFQTQKRLREMVDAGCRYAIVETSSQGIVQNRHVGIHYDVAVITNLTPEHIEAHGGFENYKAAKGKLFSTLAASPVKILNGKTIKQASIVNVLDEHAAYFMSFQAGEVIPFGRNADKITMSATGTTFSIGEVAFTFQPIGKFNFENVLCAITTAQALGFDLTSIAKSVARLAPVPGRLERIDEGQAFTVIVDYAYEPAAMHALYTATELIDHKRVIHVVGSAGGGRDVARRQVLGELAAEHDDIVIVTNEDPYDEDPMQIINDVADAARAAGTIDGQTLFRILDREEAIRQAMRLAKEGDLVLLTGKGSEPVMAVADGKKIPWDDRAAARRALQML